MTTPTATQGSDLQTLAHNWLTGGGAAAGNTYTHTFTRAHQLATASASDATFLWEPAVYQTNAYAAANNLNQYPSVTRAGIPSVLAYDANGNLTSDGTWTFAYDAENRLMTALAGGGLSSYKYDPLGRRAAKTVNTVSTFFLLSDGEEIGEYDGSGNLLRRYVTGPGTDQPIAMIGTGSSPTRDYFHTDRIGSAVAMTDNSGHVSQGPFTYDAYGQSPQTGGVPFRFTGRRLDPETGLYYFRARYYSAAQGRFLQTDPVGYKDQMNLYAYVGNDPTDKTDPSGLYPGEPFQTPGEAKRDFAEGYLPRTLVEDREYGTTFYRNPDGSFSYTQPAPGNSGPPTVQKSAPFGAPPPRGSKVIGDGHTHPLATKAQEQKGVTNDKPSGGDLFDSSARQRDKTVVGSKGTITDIHPSKEKTSSGWPTAPSTQVIDKIRVDPAVQQEACRRRNGNGEGC